jgi:hypothetical protein
MKPFYLCYKPCPEHFKLAMRPPEIANPIPPLRRGLASYFRPRIPFGAAKKLTPYSCAAEHYFQIRLPAIRRPESAIGDEPQRVLSPGRCLALRLGDNLIRHMTRSFLIPRKVHRVLGAALG